MEFFMNKKNVIYVIIIINYKIKSRGCDHDQRRKRGDPLPGHVPALSRCPDPGPGTGDVGDRQTDGLRTAAQGRDPECPHGTAVPYTQDRGH